MRQPWYGRWSSVRRRDKSYGICTELSEVNRERSPAADERTAAGGRRRSSRLSSSRRGSARQRRHLLLLLPRSLAAFSTISSASLFPTFIISNYTAMANKNKKVPPKPRGQSGPSKEAAAKTRKLEEDQVEESQSQSDESSSDAPLLSARSKVAQVPKKIKKKFSSSKSREEKKKSNEAVKASRAKKKREISELETNFAREQEINENLSEILAKISSELATLEAADQGTIPFKELDFTKYTDIPTELSKLDNGV